jgi:alkyl hydroperoxide reductase subunit AhpC
MPGYNSELEKFAGYDAQVVGISSDSVFSHVAWQKHEVGTLKYPLCSDFWPHGEVARRYGVFREGDPIPGISERAIFVIDKRGQIAFSKVYPIPEVPDVQDVYAALRKLSGVARTGA